MDKLNELLKKRKVTGIIPKERPMSDKKFSSPTCERPRFCGRG